MTSQTKESALDRLIAGDCVCLELRKATRRISRAFDEALATHGLTVGQLGILTAIKSHPGVSVQGLAKSFDMNQSAMSRTLGPLERDGLVKPSDANGDRRRKELQLTHEGEQRILAAAATWETVQNKVWDTSALDADNVLPLIRSLNIPMS